MSATRPNVDEILASHVSHHFTRNVEWGKGQKGENDVSSHSLCSSCRLSWWGRNQTLYVLMCRWQSLMGSRITSPIYSDPSVLSSPQRAKFIRRRVCLGVEHPFLWLLIRCRPFGTRLTSCASTTERLYIPGMSKTRNLAG